MNGTIQDVVIRNNGFISSADAKEANISRVALSRAVSAGDLVRIARGLYSVPEAWEDEYLVAMHRFGRGVISHETALYLHGLSEGAPERITMTFPRGYNTSSASRAGIAPKTVARDLHPLGVAAVKTPYGNEVRSYDVERTLCDMVRAQAVIDAQTFNPAMKAYLSSNARDVPKLFDYAAQLGVESKVRNYVEILL